MTAENWAFSDDYWYESNPECVKFRATNGDREVLCAITHFTLVDVFEMDDNRDAAVAAYCANRDRIHRAFERFIQDTPDKSSLLMTSKLAAFYRV